MIELNFAPKALRFLDRVTTQTTKEKRDRYARYLAEVTHEDRNLSNYLMEIGAAKPWK